jgi:pentatricopeptide repeat protein
MLKIYLLEGNKVKALEVLERMKERDILPSAETFSVLIHEILGVCLIGHEIAS